MAKRTIIFKITNNTEGTMWLMVQWRTDFLLIFHFKRSNLRQPRPKKCVCVLIVVRNDKVMLQRKKHCSIAHYNSIAWAAVQFNLSVYDFSLELTENKTGKGAVKRKPRIMPECSLIM
jgi:hypothetical protein